MKSIYIFATSERPDAYINTLAYAIDHLQITEIYIIVISEHDYAEEVREDNLLASTVVSNINIQLQALVKGQYIEKWEDLITGTTVPLQNQKTRGVYERCLKAINKSGTTGRVIPISDLDNMRWASLATHQTLFSAPLFSFDFQFLFKFRRTFS